MENIWQKYAKVLVNYSTSVKKGDKVIITGASSTCNAITDTIKVHVLQDNPHLWGFFLQKKIKKVKKVVDYKKSVCYNKRAC